MSYNPWGKKNPFLSMWLSGANAASGAARNQMSAAMHRQGNAALTEATKQWVALWGLGAPARKRTVRRRRG